jgi:hypothetical protein
MLCRHAEFVRPPAPDRLAAFAPPPLSQETRAQLEYLEGALDNSIAPRPVVAAHLGCCFLFFYVPTDSCRVKSLLSTARLFLQTGNALTVAATAAGSESTPFALATLFYPEHLSSQYPSFCTLLAFT